MRPIAPAALVLKPSLPNPVPPTLQKHVLWLEAQVFCGWQKLAQPNDPWSMGTGEVGSLGADNLKYALVLTYVTR